MKRILLLCGIIIALEVLTVCSASAQVAVIANKSIGVSSLDQADVKNFYTLITNELKGKKIRLFDYATDIEIKGEFLDMMGKTSAELRKTWLKARLTGNGTPPQTVTSEEDMLGMVASTPGAIGYVSKKNVSEDVKVLFVIKSDAGE